MPTITFQYAGQTKAVTSDAGQTLLTIAQANNVPMQSACGGNGFCTTCLCTAKAGKENLSPLNDREQNMGLEGDDRLGCQAVVQGDVTVELADM